MPYKPKHRYHHNFGRPLTKWQIRENILHIYEMGERARKSAKRKRIRYRKLKEMRLKEALMRLLLGPRCRICQKRKQIKFNGRYYCQKCEEDLLKGNITRILNDL